MVPVSLPVIVPPVIGITLRVPFLLAPTESEPPRVTLSVKTSAPLLPLGFAQSHGWLGAPLGLVRVIIGACPVTFETSYTASSSFLALASRVRVATKSPVLSQATELLLAASKLGTTRTTWSPAGATPQVRK